MAQGRYEVDVLPLWFVTARQEAVHSITSANCMEACWNIGQGKFACWRARFASALSIRKPPYDLYMYRKLTVLLEGDV
jgi:hypothetical protein